jgi:hypothetical protein
LDERQCGDPRQLHTVRTHRRPVEPARDSIGSETEITESVEVGRVHRQVPIFDQGLDPRALASRASARRQFGLGDREHGREIRGTLLALVGERDPDRPPVRIPREHRAEQAAVELARDVG